ncbi:conserved Plasmodium protein, unknown function [Plasmodium gonderi]|uniref:Rubredoxin-like domain-containing protein n=1 Tax=Plasmodium gonderi TaxID=77519 RepID=A0A1Y1JN41_PLAGO|nr:conserved Plasmodium protein, unknown function [Plasmodium gonderi]GAW82865.1 conserved Plasmodium protein, unknown function [Plasmodium gonderi]
MKTYIFVWCICMCVLALSSTRSIKIQRKSIHFIHTQALKNIYTNKKPQKNLLNVHKEQNYFKTIQFNITKVVNGVNNPYNLALIVFAFSSLIGFLYKRKKEKTTEPNESTGSENLFKYKCMKCNLVIFPAKGREQRFVKDSLICPNCGESNMNKHQTKE